MFRQSKGFTLIELMVVGTIIFILVAIAVPILQGRNPGETCMHGYAFIQTPNGPKQVFDSFGHGVKCGETEPMNGLSLK